MFGVRHGCDRKPKDVVWLSDRKERNQIWSLKFGYSRHFNRKSLKRIPFPPFLSTFEWKCNFFHIWMETKLKQNNQSCSFLPFPYLLSFPSSKYQSKHTDSWLIFHHNKDPSFLDWQMDFNRWQTKLRGTKWYKLLIAWD